MYIFKPNLSQTYMLDLPKIFDKILNFQKNSQKDISRPIFDAEFDFSIKNYSRDSFGGEIEEFRKASIFDGLVCANAKIAILRGPYLPPNVIILRV